jgi:hypothetical protein
MKTKQFYLAILGLLMTGFSYAQNTFGDIVGTFMNDKQTEGIFGARVVTTRGEEIYQAITDEDGRFRISAVPAGQYRVLFITIEGDTTQAPKTVDVAPDSYANMGIVTETKMNEIPPIIITNAPNLTYGVNPEIKLTAKEIKHMSVKFNPKEMVAAMTSEVQLKDDGSLVFRGARKGDMLTYLDGVKIRELPTVPSASIGYMMVYTGAIPAKYGDTLGGIVVIETVSYFDLLREWKARQ